MEFDNIDITMTSVLRPKIINGTLRNISERVIQNRDNVRLILNIDPIGEDVNPKEIIKIAKTWFPNIIYNVASEPSFPNAVKWTWSQATAPFVLHWEDDVDILRCIDINKMITILKNNETLSSLRLYKYDTPNAKTFSIFQAKWTYNENGYYIANRWQEQFGLNPILIKGEFVKEAALLLRDDLNPEKQFRYSREYMRPLISKWEYGIFSNPGDKALINGKKGKAWKIKIGLDKPVGRQFLNWEKKE